MSPVRQNCPQWRAAVPESVELLRIGEINSRAQGRTLVLKNKKINPGLSFGVKIVHFLMNALFQHLGVSYICQHSWGGS